MLNFTPRLFIVLALGASLAACGSSSSDSQASQQRAQRAVQIVPYQVTFEDEETNIQAVGTARAQMDGRAGGARADGCLQRAAQHRCDGQGPR